ncbi:MAG: AraC family transcriptional regulator [Pseudomonadota bacterium]
MSEPFANTALTALVFDVLSQIDPALAPAEFQRPDRFAKAAHLASEKAALLEHAFDVGGARPLVAVGRALARVQDAPVLQVLLNSTSPSIMAEKWTRLEEYHHSSHRTHIDCPSEDSWTCARYSTTGAVPSAPYNCLIFGLQTGLLRLFKCGAVVGQAEELIDSGHEDVGEIIRPRAFTHWQISWRTSPPQRDDNSFCDPHAPLLKRLSHLLAEDLGRAWKLEAAARALAQSPRSLQRRLSASGHTFSSMVRAARTTQASRLLSQTNWALSDVGYACGYADQAHFQRDFRRAVNMTPKTFRDVSRLQNENPGAN